MPQLDLQPDATTGKDTLIDSGNPTTNYGTNVEMYIGNPVKTGTIYRSIIEFDISAIPAGSTILATSLLRLYVTVAGFASVAAHIYRLRRSDWVELEATWNIYKTANNWGNAGAASSTTDIDTSISVAYTTPAATGDSDIGASGTPGTEMAAFLQDALNNRSGKVIMLLRTDAETNDGYNIKSSDASTAADRPELIIDYTTPTGFHRMMFGG